MNDKCKCGCDFHPGIPCDEAMAFEGRGPYYKKTKKIKALEAKTKRAKFLKSKQKELK